MVRFVLTSLTASLLYAKYLFISSFDTRDFFKYDANLLFAELVVVVALEAVLERSNECPVELLLLLLLILVFGTVL